MTENPDIKEEAITMIASMTGSVSWDDVIYEAYVMKKIEKGIEAADAGDFVSLDEVKKRFAK